MLRERVRCGVLLVLLLKSLAGQNVITTIAGIDSSFDGDGRLATVVPIGYVNGVATDGAGNVYFTDPLEHLVLRVAPNGILSVIAGNGIAGYSGDGGPATSAAIAASDSPEQYVRLISDELSLGGVAIDKQGNVYFGDSHRVRMVSPQGIITTVAGGGGQTTNTVVRANQAALGIVNGLAFDSAGNLYFSEGNRVRMLAPSGSLTTFAGTGTGGFSGDGGQASAAELAQPLGLAFDGQGNLYVADGSVSSVAPRIRRITPAGVISTIAGGGTTNPANGVAPLSLSLPQIGGLAVDSSGAVYGFGPSAGLLIKLSGTTPNTFTTTTLITSTVAAPFTPNVPASGAYVVGQGLFDNSGISFDSAGNLYVADSRDGYLGKIDMQGVLRVVAGNGSYGFSGDGGPALGAQIQGPTAMTQTPDGTIYFIDSLNARVRAISPQGVITTALSAANFSSIGNTEVINGITSDPSGNVYVLLAHRLIELTPKFGTVTIIVNQSGVSGDKGDGGPALQAAFQGGGSLMRDSTGNLYFTDPNSCRIREVTVDGKIHTIAGTGVRGFTPDGMAASGSPLATPTALLLDALGGLYFEESPMPGLGNGVIRYITPSGILKTIAGNGQGGFSGDGGLATQAGLELLQRTGLALDKSGNLYIADGFNSRVRVVSPSGIINTFAGNGVKANAGDGGLAQSASFFVPQGLLFDAQGDLLISDVAGNNIRKVLASAPAISTSPIQMNFSAMAGGAKTPPQKLTISSPIGGLAFTLSASPGAGWLVIDASAGSTPQLIGVRADPSSLTPGTYQATLSITAPQAAQVLSTVAITFQVGPGSPPKLAIEKSALSFTFPRNPTTTLTQLVGVSNAGTGTLAFSTSVQTNNGGPWLSANPATGTATPQEQPISVTANPNGLRAGTYTGKVIVASSTTGESATVLITLTVSTLDQAIELTHTALSFTSVAGGGVVPVGTFAVKNIGRGTMNFSVSTSTLSGGPQWLSAVAQAGSVTSGSPATRVTVTVNQSGLAPGRYYGSVRVDSPMAANTPQVSTIALNVLPAGQDPGPLIEPSEIVITAIQGASPPGSMNLFVYNISATPQAYISSVAASDPGDQFKIVPKQSELPLSEAAKLVVQPLTGNLSAGVYEAELTLQFSDGVIRRVGMRTIVMAAPATTGTTVVSNAVQAVSGCTPTKLVPAITSLGQSFGVPAAWPVALEANVLDDCGNTLDSGNVGVSFSNGDPPLSLRSLQGGGLWEATWMSGHSGGPVTLTVTATDPTRNLTGTREVTGGLGDSSQGPMLNAAVIAAGAAMTTPLAPGAIISLYGQGLANGTASASAIPLSSTLAGATILMAGNPLPLYFASNGQINAVVSEGINTNTNQQIVVQRDNTLSAPISVDVGPAEPAVFGYPLPGDPPNQGAIENARTYVVAQPGTPVTAGDALAIFCTGLGAVDQPVADGAGAPSPPANTLAVPTVTIGGKMAQVIFSGLSPGSVALYQIDAIVPSGVAPGDQVPVVVSVGGQPAPVVTIAVK